MAFGKILLLWQQSWYALSRTPLTTWLGLIALHIQRYYYALLRSYAFFIVLGYALSMYYVKNNLFGVFITLLMLSLIIYLMRPTVGLKKINYLLDYISLETITSSLAIIFVYLLLAALLPKWFMGVVVVSALCSFAFLYDATGSIPDKVGYALARTGYFLLYKAPVLCAVALVASATVYINFGFVGLLLNMLVLYPLYAAIITILYVSALHENYELYYAE